MKLSEKYLNKVAPVVDIIRIDEARRYGDYREMETKNDIATGNGHSDLIEASSNRLKVMAKIDNL